MVQISVSVTLSVDRKKGSFSDHSAAKRCLRFKNTGMFGQPTSLFSFKLVTFWLRRRAENIAVFCFGKLTHLSAFRLAGIIDLIAALIG